MSRRRLVLLSGLLLAAVAAGVLHRAGHRLDRGGAAHRVVSLVLSPAVPRRSVGETQHFTAVEHFADGHSRNVTQHVQYRSSDTGIAATPNAEGDRSAVRALAPGTATITARDPATGITSNEVAFTVLGALERITLSPSAPRQVVGQSQHFTATGHFAGGTTRNLTQRVVYHSSDERIARATNAEGDRSRVEAVSPGTVIVSASDPGTGVSTSDGGGDATLTVLSGPDQRIRR